MASEFVLICSDVICLYLGLSLSRHVIRPHLRRFSSPPIAYTPYSHQHLSPQEVPLIRYDHGLKVIFRKNIYQAGTNYHPGNLDKLPVRKHCSLNCGHMIKKENFLNEWLLIHIVWQSDCTKNIFYHTPKFPTFQYI